MKKKRRRAKGIAKLERRLGHLFAIQDLLSEALNHRSYTYEKTGSRALSNERLEFLGDAVLDMAVSALLHRRFPEADEGRLTRLRANLVNEQTLSRVAREIGLGPFMKLGRGEAASGGAEKPSILADGMEAILGAVFLDAGYETAAGLVAELWAPLLTETGDMTFLKDYKTRLQEFMQEHQKATPVYRVVDSDGPDHRRTFHVQVLVNGRSLAQGRGGSKKEAEQEAARLALTVLGDNEAGGGSEY